MEESCETVDDIEAATTTTSDRTCFTAKRDISAKARNLETPDCVKVIML
jgi:hypothetical protein